MSIPITRTRILVPKRRADVLSRQRLLDLFYELLEHKLIIISAPAGYGKTTLLIDLAYQNDLPVCWYTLGALDVDLQRFAGHFIASLADRFPDFGKSSLAALKNTSAGLNLEQLVTAVVNDAYEHIQEHFILVLDDHHFVNDNSDISHFISKFVQLADEHCHLVLASRALPTLPELPLMAARSQVAGIDLEALAFRADEVRALILRNYNLTMTESAAEELVRETEGWITGLLLSAQTMWQGMADRVRLARVSGVELYDYLVQQVLNLQPVSVREFLLRSSLLEEFNDELCTAVLEPADYLVDKSWQDLIDEATLRNLFILPVGDDKWVRYHQLFQDFLQAQMAQEHPQETVTILRRLADTYAGRKEWEKAHDYYCRLGDVETIADLIERAGLSLIYSGLYQVLAEWIDALPDEVVASRPRLLSLYGTVAVDMGEVESGLEWLNLAEKGCLPIGDIVCLAHTLVRRAGAHRALGDYQASLTDVGRALDLVTQHTDLQTVQTAALRAKGITLRHLGRPYEAIDDLKQAEDLNRQMGNSTGVALVQNDLGIAYRAVGLYEEAEQAYQRALDYWHEVGDLERQASILNNLGVLYHRTGHYERAAAHLDKAVLCARQNGSVRMIAWGLASISDLHADLDASDSALNAHRQARKTLDHIHDSFLEHYLRVTEAALARLSGDFSTAHDLLQLAQHHAQESDSGYEWGLYHLEVGRLALAEDRGREAIQQFQESFKMFDAAGQRTEAACASLKLASALDTIEGEAAAMPALAEVFHQMADDEHWQPLIVAARDMRELLDRARSEPAIGHHVSKLSQKVVYFESTLPKLRRRLRQQAAAVPFVPPQLVIKALGKTEVWLEEEVVTRSDWQTRVARDIFFLLLAHPEGLSREAVGTIFWPESPTPKLNLNFKKTLYRLRRALGQDVVLFNEGLNRYFFNWDLDYNYDVETFRAELARAESVTNSAELKIIYRKAAELYRGPYLPQVDGVWILTERAALQRAYQDTVLKLATICLTDQEYERVLTWCRRLLVEDPCHEEAHCLAMRAHAALGHQADIFRQFKVCKQALQSEIQAQPSPETVELYRVLTHKQKTPPL